MDDIKIKLSKGDTLFRARTGFEASFRSLDGFDSAIVREPYTGADIGASPNPGNGRLNRAGDSALYLGSNSYTALAEIRPHPGHYVSTGGFDILKDLDIADFNPDIAFFSMNENRLEMYQLIQFFDRLMSTPVTPDDTISYLITQLLAELLKARGFHGVQFRSSVSDGFNLCLFDPNHAEFVEGHSGVNFIESVHYKAPERPSVTEPDQNEHLLRI